VSAAEPEIWVVVASDDLIPRYRNRPENAGRAPNPIVFETNVNGATRENAMKRAAQLDGPYGACRIARLVFDEPAKN
jgi:hypothetical protein